MLSVIFFALLAGVFITREYLDLFDFESYLSDNASTIVNGGEITVEDQEKYNGRLYAVLKPRTLTNEETGDTTEHWEYVFEETTGIPFILVETKQPDGQSYMGSSSDGSVSDAHDDQHSGCIGL